MIPRSTSKIIRFLISEKRHEEKHPIIWFASFEIENTVIGVAATWKKRTWIYCHTWKTPEVSNWKLETLCFFSGKSRKDPMLIHVSRENYHEFSFVSHCLKALHICGCWTWSLPFPTFEPRGEQQCRRLRHIVNYIYYTYFLYTTVLYRRVIIIIIIIISVCVCVCVRCLCLSVGCLEW